jgi:hypothetical protein
MVLRVGQQATAPAAYVRAVGLTVERPEQSYLRLADEAGQQRYQYTAPVFGFACRLGYDDAGPVPQLPRNRRPSRLRPSNPSDVSTWATRPVPHPL